MTDPRLNSKMDDEMLTFRPKQLFLKAKQKCVPQKDMNAKEGYATYHLTASAVDVHVAGKIVEEKIGQSRKLKSEPLLKGSFDAESKKSGHILAMHIDGTYLAYGIQVSPNNFLRIISDKTGKRAIHKNFTNSIIDIDFSEKKSPIKLAVLDASSTIKILQVVDLDNDSLTVSEILQIKYLRDGLVNRVFWGGYAPKVQECSNVSVRNAFAVLQKDVIEVYDMDEVVEEYLDSTKSDVELHAEDIVKGVVECRQAITEEPFQTYLFGTLSPDTSTLAGATDGNILYFYQTYIPETREVPARQLHKWQPHPSGQLCAVHFLDNRKGCKSGDIFWQHCITAVDNCREIRIWVVEGWQKMQTLRFEPSEFSPDFLKPVIPNFELHVDSTGQWLVMSDSANEYLYMMMIQQNESCTKLKASDLVVFHIGKQIIDLVINSAEIRWLRNVDDSVVEDHLSDDEEGGEVDRVKSVKCYLGACINLTVMHTKGLQRLTFPGIELESLKQQAKADLFAENNIKLISEISNSKEVNGGKSGVEMDVSQDLEKLANRVSSNAVTQCEISPLSIDSEEDADVSHLDGEKASSERPLSCGSLAEPLPDSSPSSVQKVMDKLTSLLAGERLDDFGESNMVDVLQPSNTSPGNQLGALIPNRSGTPSNITDLLSNTQVNNIAADQTAQASKSTELQISFFDNFSSHTTTKTDADVKRLNFDEQSSSMLSSHDNEEIVENDGKSTEPKGYMKDLEEISRESLENTAPPHKQASSTSPKADVEETFQNTLSLSQNLDSGSRPIKENVTQQLADFTSKIGQVLNEFSQNDAKRLDTLDNKMERLKVGQRQQEVQAKQDKNRMEEQINAIQNCAENIEAKCESIQRLQHDNGRQIDKSLHKFAEQLHKNMQMSLESLQRDTDNRIVTSQMTERTVHHIVHNSISKLLSSEDGTRMMASRMQLGFAQGMQHYTENMMLKLQHVLQVCMQQIGTIISQHTAKNLKDVETIFNNFRMQINEVFVTTAKADSQKQLKLLQQLNGKLENQFKTFESYQNEMSKDLKSCVQENASSIVEQQREIFKDTVGVAMRSAAATPLPASVYEQQLTLPQLEAMISSGQVSSAFESAANSRDQNLVVAVCELVDISGMFAQVPCPLDQTLILSILSILCNDLGKQTTTKCIFIEESLPTLDISADEVKRFGPHILPGVVAKLKDFVALNSTHKASRKFKMLATFANSMAGELPTASQIMPGSKLFPAGHLLPQINENS